MIQVEEPVPSMSKSDRPSKAAGLDAVPPARPAQWYLRYLFGGLFLVLCVGSIIVFCFWYPDTSIDPAPYHLGLGVLILVVIILQESFHALQKCSAARLMRLSSETPATQRNEIDIRDRLGCR